SGAAVRRVTCGAAAGAALIVLAPARAFAVPPGPPESLVAPGGVREARDYARGRAGTVGFAVVEPGGRLRGLRVNRWFYSASVVKAMLALEVVREARHRRLTATERALLRPMITVSDNAAASAVYRRVGGAGLYRVARAAHMTRFTDVGHWSDAHITPADQARLFLRIDTLAPRRHRSYLRGLLGSIVPSQRWGIAPVAADLDFRIMFKGGWRTGLSHQVALLERDGRRIALAVLTRGAADRYGRRTETGVARRILAARPSRSR
ncbi:MAG TPA: serine hydrolase, partial [Solirubrobacteraceae bacterium]|nr:serine hydrolase [Solirubrobacteraceae bacterium]